VHNSASQEASSKAATAAATATVTSKPRQARTVKQSAWIFLMVVDWTQVWKNPSAARSAS
jgi:hypothetical protein